MIYSHARQFPHLTGMADPEIKLLVRGAMADQARYRRLWRMRNLAMLVGMLSGGVALIRVLKLDPGLAMMIVGGLGTLFLLGWNFIWVNTVLFRVTRQAMDRFTLDPGPSDA